MSTGNTFGENVEFYINEGVKPSTWIMQLMFHEETTLGYVKFGNHNISAELTGITSITFEGKTYTHINDVPSHVAKILRERPEDLTFNSVQKVMLYHTFDEDDITFDETDLELVRTPLELKRFLMQEMSKELLSVYKERLSEEEIVMLEEFQKTNVYTLNYDKEFSEHNIEYRLINEISSDTELINVLGHVHLETVQDDDFKLTTLFWTADYDATVSAVTNIATSLQDELL